MPPAARRAPVHPAPARLRETVGSEVYGDIVIGPLADLTVVVVDVETTGWLQDDAEITEIGAVRCSHGQLTGEFSSLVRPAGPIPADVSSLTGISEHMVSGAPLAAA